MSVPPTAGTIVSGSAEKRPDRFGPFSSPPICLTFLRLTGSVGREVTNKVLLFESRPGWAVPIIRSLVCLSAVPLGYREQASGRHGQGPPRPGGAEAAFRCPRAPLAPGSTGVRLGLSAAPSAPTGRLAPDPMASEAPPPSLSPSPPPSPEPELAQLRRKVETLERELRSCKRQVREIEKLLHHTERLYQSAESNNQELRTQVRRPVPAPRPTQRRGLRGLGSPPEGSLAGPWTALESSWKS